MIFSPKAKILLYLLLGIAVFSFSSFRVSLILVCIVAAFAVKIPLSSLKRGVIPIILFLTFTFISNILFQEGKIIYEIFSLPVTYEGLMRGGQLTLRLFILILGAKILTSTTRAADLVTAMSQLLGPVGRIAYVKELVYTMSLTLQLLPIVYEEALDSYRSVRNSDEAGLTGKIKLAVELLSSLFDRSLERAKEMSGNNEEDMSESGNREI